MQQAFVTLPSEASLDKLGLFSSVRFRSALSNRAPQRGRAGSSSQVEHPSEAERGRPANSSAPRKDEQSQAFRALRPEPERARAAMSSAPARPSGLKRPSRAPQRSRAGSSGHLERPSGAERARAAISSAPAEPSGARAAISSAPAEPSGLERPISSAPAEPSGLERLFRAPQRSRAGSKSQTSAGAVFSRQAEPS